MTPARDDRGLTEPPDKRLAGAQAPLKSQFRKAQEYLQSADNKEAIAHFQLFTFTYPIMPSTPANACLTLNLTEERRARCLGTICVPKPVTTVTAFSLLQKIDRNFLFKFYARNTQRIEVMIS